MCTELGESPAHPSAFLGGIRIASADAPADFLIRKTTDKIFAIRYRFEQPECFRRPDIIPCISPVPDFLFPTDPVDFLFDALGWDDIAHGIKEP